MITSQELIEQTAKLYTHEQSNNSINPIDYTSFSLEEMRKREQAWLDRKKERFKQPADAVDVIQKPAKEFVYKPYNEVKKLCWELVQFGFIDEENNMIVKPSPLFQITNWHVDFFRKFVKYANFGHGSDEIETWDVNKSLCLVGETGSYKTSFIRILNVLRSELYPSYIQPRFFINRAEDVSKLIASTKDTSHIDYYSEQNRCFDDLCQERKSLAMYGEQGVNPMKDILKKRFDSKTHMFTHMTINSTKESFDQLIVDNYGSAVHSRLIENCHIIHFPSKDYRIENAKITQGK